MSPSLPSNASPRGSDPRLESSTIFVFLPFVAEEPPQWWVVLTHVNWVNVDLFLKLPLLPSFQGFRSQLALGVQFVRLALERAEPCAQAGTIFGNADIGGWHCKVHQ